ncbi:MAG: hypothetical protein ABI240_06505 [Sphingomonas sp.]
MDDIDGMLARLAGATLPAALEGLEARVLDRLSAPSDSHTGVAVAAFAIVGALAMGMGSAGLPVPSARARSPLSPFAPNSPLAPSTLLAGTP